MTTLTTGVLNASLLMDDRVVFKIFNSEIPEVTAFSDTLVMVQLTKAKFWTADFSGNAEVWIRSMLDDSKVMLYTESPEKELGSISPMLDE